MESKKREFSYYRLYLQRLLREQGFSAVSDVSDDLLDGRSEAAEETFEESRRHGLSVVQSQECAMAVLLEGFN